MTISKSLADIELLGHVAHISVGGQLADGIRRKEDRIVVYFSFDEAVDSTLGFAISLPAIKYTRDEFLWVAKAEGYKRLQGILEQSERDRQKCQDEKERQKRLNDLVESLRQELKQ